jgi:hypothetical protein
MATIEDDFDIVRLVTAAVDHWHEDGRGKVYCLQIELSNNHWITLTVSDNEPLAVTLWRGNGKQVVPVHQTIGSFREFVADAFELQP